MTNDGNYSAAVTVLERVFPFSKERGRQGEANTCVSEREREYLSPPVSHDVSACLTLDSDLGLIYRT